MSSTRAARVIAGLGVTGVLAGSGFVLVSPADAADAATPTATYNCSVAGQAPVPVAVDFSVPSLPASAVPVGTTFPAIPISATADLPATLVGDVIGGLVLEGSPGSPEASLPVPSALAGTIAGNSSLGGQSLPTSLDVATPLTSLMTTLISGIAANAGPLGPTLAPLLAPFENGTATLGDLNGLSSFTSLSSLGTMLGSALPTGLPLTDGTGATPSMNGTISSFTVKKVGAQQFKLPSTINADLLKGALPPAPCTYASGAQTVGTLNVTKDASAIKSAKAAGSKLTVTVANASGTALKPTGKVAAYAGSKKVGTGSLKNGVSSFALKGLKRGANKLTLKYAGSSLFSAAKSKAVTVLAK